MAHKILVSAPVPLELILTAFDWVGAGPWGFGTGLYNLWPCLFFNFSLCERSPRDIKLHYAFSIYDFDGDNFIGVGDIEQVLLLLHSLFMKRYKIFRSGHKTFDTRAVD